MSALKGISEVRFRFVRIGFDGDIEVDRRGHCWRSVHDPHVWCGRASQEVFVELAFKWQPTGRQCDELFGLTGTPELQDKPRCAKVDRKPRLGRAMNTPRRCNVLMLYPLFVADSR